MKPRPPMPGRARRGHVVASNSNTNARVDGLAAHTPQVSTGPDDNLAALPTENAARDRRLREGAQIHALGPRLTAEFIEAARLGAVDLAEFDRLRARFANVDPALLCIFGGDRLPPLPPPHLVEPTGAGAGNLVPPPVPGGPVGLLRDDGPR